MKHIVEVVVCECNDDGKRWVANGHIVGEFDDPAIAQVVADKMVKVGAAVRDVILDESATARSTGATKRGPDPA